VQVPDVKDVGTNHASIKQGGKIEKEGNVVSVIKRPAADNIGRHCNEEQAREGSHRGDIDRNTVSPHYFYGVLKNHLVGFKSEPLGQNTVTEPPDKTIVGKGSRNQEKEREYAC
jgi:hypothetical protein